MERLDNLDEIIMSILFVAGQGVEIEDIASKLNVSVDKVKTSLDNLKKKYASPCGINIITYKSKAQLSSNPEYSDFIADVLNPIKERALSKNVLETMAIIAYKQPITRLEIESIRGVSSDYAVQVLLNHNLIEVVGRKDVIGKPLLFGTTEEFLKRFDLQSLDDLPNYESLLERIQIINVGNTTDSMYNEYDLEDEDSNEDNEALNSNNTQQNQENIDESQCATNDTEEIDEKLQKLAEECKDSDIDIDEIPDFLKDENNVQFVN